MKITSATLTSVLLLIAGITTAQRPANVQVTSYPGNNRCSGASRVATVSPGSGCHNFAGNGALSYEVNRDSDTCRFFTYAGANCAGRFITRRDLDFDSDLGDQECEELPQRVRSYRIRCGFPDNDDDDN